MAGMVHDFRYVIKKHRLAEHVYAADFGPNLPDEVQLKENAAQPEGLPEVRIVIPRVREDIDVTDQFLAPGSPEVQPGPSSAVRDRVSVRLRAAIGNDQLGGVYRILFRAQGTDEETYALLGRLYVVRGGSNNEEGG